MILPLVRVHLGLLFEGGRGRGVDPLDAGVMETAGQVHPALPVGVGHDESGVDPPVGSEGPALVLEEPDRGLDVLSGVGRAILEDHRALVDATLGADLVQEGAGLGLAQVGSARAHPSRENDQGSEPALVHLEAAVGDLQVEVPEADDGVCGDDLVVPGVQELEEGSRVLLVVRRHALFLSM